MPKTQPILSADTLAMFTLHQPRIICVPYVLKTDNGPSLNNSAFEQFANYLEFKHWKLLAKGK